MSEKTTALALMDGNELEVIQRTGKLLAASGYFDAKGDAITQMAQMAAKIMAGRELGFGPFASVNGIYIIKGRPSISASLMATAVKNSQRYDYRVKRLDNDGCTLEFFEMVNGKRESIGISTFTSADATKAGTENMGKFPRNMMFARAMSNGVKWFCPDVFSGNAIYVPEELGAETDGDGNVVEGSMRVVDTATGEIFDRPVAIDDDAPSTPEAVIASWRNSAEMFQWAVDVGGCANTFEAKNSWKNVVTEHGGEVTDENRETIRRAFYDKQLRKAEEHRQIEAVAA
jgi:hypothetical protein